MVLNIIANILYIDYYYYITGLKQTLVNRKSFQKNEIRENIYHKL